MKGLGFWGCAGERYVMRRYNASVTRFIGSTPNVRTHYTPVDRMGGHQMALKPCRCMGEHTWRRDVLMRRLHAQA